MRNKSKTPQKTQRSTILTTRKFSRNYMDKMLKEMERDEKWKTIISEELNCQPKETRRKVLEKFQKILASSLSNALIEVDKEEESITFHSTANAFTFFEKISLVFQCNLVVNELSVHSDVNYLKNCEIHLTEDNILCEISNNKIANQQQIEEITDDDVTRLENILESGKQNSSK